MSTKPGELAARKNGGAVLPRPSFRAPKLELRWREQWRDYVKAALSGKHPLRYACFCADQLIEEERARFGEEP